ncbi:MAG: S-layer homology domain-containing protein [Oscillibacter sp.]|nr:S-layer homology domain-containing protein [Oscillibacter sp.]
MKRWMVLLSALVLCISLLGGTAAAVESAPLYVGGVELAAGQYLDLAGNVTYEAPEGGYAHYGEDGVLTLHEYSYTGDGYVYESVEVDGEMEHYSAVIWREGDVDIVLEGKSHLNITYTDAELNRYGDVIMVDPVGEDGPSSLTLRGDGSLKISECDYGLAAYYGMHIEDVELSITCASTAIQTGFGPMTLENAKIGIYSEGDGISSGGDLVVTDTELDIAAGWAAVHMVDGDMYLECTKVQPAAYAPVFLGTRLQIMDIENECDYAPFEFYNGELHISERLTVSEPESFSMKHFEGYEDADGDGVNDPYDTMVDSGGNVAAKVIIEPLSYYVTPVGLDISYDIAIPVPVGMSLQEVYGEKYAPILAPEREGYVFGGWYTDEECTEGCEFSVDAPVTGELTIYAKWTEGEEETESAPKAHTCRSECDICGGCMDEDCTKRSCREKCVLLTLDFADVAEDAWYAEAVEYVCHRGIMQGGSDTAFSPEGGVNRAMMAEILWNLAGQPKAKVIADLADVKQDRWYSEAVNWVVEEGFMQGYGDGSFGLGDELSREQLAVILYRYEQAQGGGFVGSWMFLLDCADRAEISPWAYEAVCWMKMHGVMNGKGAYMAPKDLVMNAEAAAVVMRYLEL